MTGNEIIKALEYCSTNVRENTCPKCIFYKKPRCSTLMLNAASDLINRQRAEIERYKAVIKLLEKDVEKAKNELQQTEMEADIMEEMLEDRNKDISDLIFKERENAVTEFAEMLKENADNYIAGEDFVLVSEIDDALKEWVKE